MRKTESEGGGVRDQSKILNDKIQRKQESKEKYQKRLQQEQREKMKCDCEKRLEIAEEGEVNPRYKYGIGFIKKI